MAVLFNPKAKRVAVIDLGSNTARLIVMGAVPGYAYRLEDEIREVVRLRQGMRDNMLSQAAVARALATLRLFKRYCDSSQVDLILATATSAVRDAHNGPQFVQRVRREIGLSLKVLDGEQEAYYAVLGVLNEVPLTQGYVLDIGGGSAQLSQVRGRRFKQGHSMPLGALALTEQFVTADPITAAELTAVQTEIDAHLDTIPWLPPEANARRQLIGLGGTIRNAAKMAASRQDYPLNTLHGFCLTRAEVQTSIEQLSQFPLKERQRIPGLSSDRADIILPGIMVLASVMDRLQVDEVTISMNGLREGLFLEHFWDHLAYPVVDNVRRFSVLNMARIYQYQKSHANHVRYLSGRLFNQLAPLHNYGSTERELLDAAALLHDLGTIISYYDHHKHSRTLIINSGLAGFTPREVALLSQLVRYHRKGTPKRKRFKSLLSKEDRQILLRLTAILRLAEFLERGRNATVDDITAAWDDHTLHLTLIADEYPAVELWEAERNASKLVAKAFGRQVKLQSTAAPE